MAVIPETIGPSTEAVNLVTWGTDPLYQFAVWYTLAGELRVGRIVKGIQRWGIDHDQYQVAGIPRTILSLPVTNDGHNIAAIAIDGLARLHVQANMHSAPMQAIRTVDPHDADTWLTDAGWTSAVSDFAGSEIDATYPFPTHMPDGSLIFYIRSGTNTSGSGRCDSFLYRRTPGGTSWSSAQKLFQGLSVPDAKGPGVAGDDSSVDTEFNWSAYPSGPLLVESARSPHPGRLHSCWVWRIGADDGERLNPLPCYAYSDDGGTTWYAVDGTATTLPFTPLNNIACRLPGHARITSIIRAGGFLVTATLDQTAASAGIQVGQSYVVQFSPASTFDGTFSIGAVGPDSGLGLAANQIAWIQAGGNETDTFGYIGVDDYQNGQAIAIDDAGHPNILHSITPAWWTRWDGSTWTQTQIPTTINGQQVAGVANSAFTMRGDIWLLKSAGGSGHRHPAAFNLEGPGIVALGGPTMPTGGHESSYDPEAYRRFGTVEVLCCDGDTPRVFTFGRRTRVRPRAA